MLALLATAVFFVFQANRGPRAETQKSAPDGAGDCGAGRAQEHAGHASLPSATSNRTRPSRSRRAPTGNDVGEVQGGRRGSPGRCPVRNRSASIRRDAASRRRRISLKDKALSTGRWSRKSATRICSTKNFISPDAYEQVRTNAATAAATVSADEAAIENAQLSLEYCTIRSPVTGYAGRIQIQQGNLVKANDTNPLVTINQVVPIYSSFSVPEQSLADIRRVSGGRRTEGAGALADTRAPAGRGQAVVHRQLGGYDDRHDQAQGRVSEYRQGTLAGPVRQRRAHALRTEGRRRRAIGRRAERPQRAVRLHRQLRSDRRPARHQGPACGWRRNGHRQRPQAGRAGRHRRSASPRAGHQGESPPKLHREHRRTVRPPAGDDDAGHDRHPDLRLGRLPAPAGQRAAQRRFPDDPGHGEPAGRQPGYDGVVGRDAAREAVLDHRRHRLDDLDIDQRQHDDRPAVRARPQHRRRGAGRAVGDRRRRPVAPVGNADAADPAQGQSRGLLHSAARAHLGDAAAVGRRRLRREQPGPADLDDQRRGAGAGVRVAAVCGAHPARPQRARDPRHRAHRRRAGGRQCQRQFAHGHAVWPRARHFGAWPRDSSTMRRRLRR